MDNKWLYQIKTKKKRRYQNIAACVVCTLALGVVTPAGMVWADEAQQDIEKISNTENELDEYTLDTVTVEAKRPDWESKLSPGTVTVIRPDDYKGEQKTLPELLKKVPGVHVREVNGKGQYTTVTVRGSTAAQVGVFIDGVLSNLGGDAAVDISTIPVDNVERIEVYRGYIPTRFAGTFMGGVINIVTKKPTKANISAEVGKSSYGGTRAALEIMNPLGSGSLLIGINHDGSDQNFKYENYAAGRNISDVQLSINSLQEDVDDFNPKMIDMLTSGGKPLISMSDSDKDYYKANFDAWIEFIRSTGDKSLSHAIEDNAKNVAQKSSMSTFRQTMIDMGIKDQYIAAGYPETGWTNWWDFAGEDWNYHGSETGIIDDNVKNQIIDTYVQNTTPKIIDEWTTIVDPDKSTSLASSKEELEAAKKKLKALQDKERYRRYNDYKKDSAMIKWQDDNFVIKGSWNKIQRHLPDSLWGDSVSDAATNALVDTKDIFYASSRKQELENSEILLQNRAQYKKLEWGWMIDYLHQDKKYRTEHMLDYPNNFRWNNIPLREWSHYQSDKYNVQLDGNYQINDNQMLEYQFNFSHEKLNIKGSLLDKVLGDDVIGNILGQTRNRYEQDLFNMQIQDAITLDKEGTCILTPSIRYNQSKITGFSDGKRFPVNQSNKFHWLHQEDSQTDGKATWQLALKKEFNDSFSLRMTGGTYYRLLNMYEIAGDGAGILPASRDGSSSSFPLPEEGMQFDISALWNGKTLGADNNTTLTYFWRDSDNMLQLVRAGLDYWSYFNDSRAKVHGIELESQFKWNKYSLDLRTTYTKVNAQKKNTAVNYPYTDIWMTYQPEWESSLRLTYTPNNKISIFGELHYTDEYFTSTSRDSRGGNYAYLSGKPVSSLTVINTGVKWKPEKDWQINIGCNDIFNKGPKQKIYSPIAFTEDGYINAEFPLQGRTYYATVRYEF
ncbi:TonB-dependent receptor [Anaerosinus gibii]|uniref:TonB-dependent receptor plug domain-containing protein n=1 Tax=Selenobaculum gibii TaxID=3054208 RepID=A0A9Y2ESV0_9FIRM|nr:TonB-dependent receptor [Selenobaculum gbiensis]WIW71373.1 TonB-dependent receptor plug domain-containing protein [Selenobaculum gbiensis]